MTRYARELSEKKMTSRETDDGVMLVVVNGGRHRKEVSGIATRYADSAHRQLSPAPAPAPESKAPRVHDNRSHVDAERPHQAASRGRDCPRARRTSKKETKKTKKSRWRLKNANAPPINSPRAPVAAASELYPVLSMHPRPLFELRFTHRAWVSGVRAVQTQTQMKATRARR
jgi:hypothetical protein